MSKTIDTTTVVEELKWLDDFYVDSVMKDAWVKFTTDSGQISWEKVSSQSYQRRIQMYCYQEYRQYPRREQVVQIYYALQCHAAIENKVIEIHLRVAKIESSIFYNLGNKSNIVQITSDKYEVISGSDIPFRNPRKQKEQVLPDKSGKINMFSLFDFLNIEKRYQVLFATYLISCFIPDIQHPLLVLCGGAGQGKSTISAILKSLVDPSEVDSVPLSSLTSQDLSLTLYDSWLTVFDNTSYISKEKSDDLCRAVTGSGYEKRKLYSDDDTHYMLFKRVMVLNSIKNVLRQEDIIDRSLIFNIRQIDDKSFRLNSDLMADFKADKKYYLHLIFSTLSKAMAIYSRLEYVPKSRMAEFEKWGYAIAIALGKGTEFLDQYQKMLHSKLDETISNNTMLTAIEYLIQHEPDHCWNGRCIDLLFKLEKIARLQRFDMTNGTMPITPEKLSADLTAYEHILKMKSIRITRHPRTRMGTSLTIEIVK